MEERYEIRGKIGQGGLGAVYKGYDTRMNREVAIKRISVSNDDPALQEESTRQLIKEAGALASLQHPHIVTVYDVGSDEDGPYVVMELINGKTLDELIERAPLTWPDFRELAIQTQEALIAAQELDLIHSDIKPSNLMLTWLPSGKFQMKIVDFGLATLTQSQTKEELEELEAVFGSIFFMAPEQFERVPIDARTDVYAMGCVYYQALTGTYPFKGETGHEVMVSHLHHKVVPLQEVRADIPMWACDWIMWQLNRMPEDRPASAREALQVFLQNDKNPSPTMSLGRATPPPATGPRSHLASRPPSATRKVVDPRMAPPGYVPPPDPEPEPPEPIPEPPLTTTAPQPLLPPEGSKPSIHTGPHIIPDPTPTVAATVPLNRTGRVMPTKSFTMVPSKKAPVSGIKIAIAAALGIVIVLLGFMLYQRIQASQGSHRIGDIMELASKTETTEIPMSGTELAKFLELATSADTDAKRDYAKNALVLAKPTDNSDFDATLVEFITKSPQLPEDRAALISKVLGKRMKESLVQPLMNFARSTTNDFDSAVAAIEAVRPNVGNAEFGTFLDMVQYDKNPGIRQAAEDTGAAIVKRSGNRGDLIAQIDKAIEATTDPKILEALKRMKSGQ
ncbi:MAG: protein kinase [Luteolibacter sp.]|uniref:serine/threonine protein kinase n=1 Tax=Luteolibacter sp. TaxID=1962973 RepID=UPI0032643A6F